MSEVVGPRIGRTPPTFPEDGTVTVAMITDGLVFDFTNSPGDLDYWSPSLEQARCAAGEIVDELGADRLADLGYRPGVTGASLNDVELSDEQRYRVAELFSDCVDMVEGFSAILIGSARMEPSTATCVAEGLGEADLLGPFSEAIAFGRAVDPFEDDSALAEGLLSYASVCISNGALNWTEITLPDRTLIYDADAPAGERGSLFADDNTTTTTAAP